MGIEPTPSAWKAEVLPLNYTRRPLEPRERSRDPFCLVVGAGFEPAKAEPADLQSAPVDRLGTPPRTRNFSRVACMCQPNTHTTCTFGANYCLVMLCMPNLVPLVGFELTTYRLQGGCSTN
jgi:hypothetical protein